MIRVIGVVILAMAFLCLLVFVNLRKKKENQVSILFRIMTNYIHLITSAMTFEIQIPDEFSKIFSQTNRVGSANETFFSFD